MIHRLRDIKIGILRAKWLTELEEEENIRVLTRFIKRYTKGCNKVAIKRYFLKDRLYTVSELY